MELSTISNKSLKMILMKLIPISQKVVRMELYLFEKEFSRSLAVLV